MSRTRGNWRVAAAALVLAVAVGCATTSYDLVLAARQAQILAEPAGDYYVGRRYFRKGTRLWGYLRRPRQPWISAQLVIINEQHRLQPDRLKEVPTDGSLPHGFDHNYEYRFWGRFSGREVYDPNSDYVLPEFILENYEVVRERPGFLFAPNENFNPEALPPKLQRKR
ncbi:MAG: hypothetical protein ACC661_12430 [Verrucomicrobiales bacterium]